MARGLRVEHYAAVAQTGLDVHRELRARFDVSYLRRACLVGDRLVALWGVEGSVASTWGVVWLALTDEATRYPVALVKAARRQIDEVMWTKRDLATTIIGGDDATRRFAAFMGFHSEDDEPEERVVVGSTYAVALCYRQEA